MEKTPMQPRYGKTNNKDGKSQLFKIHKSAERFLPFRKSQKVAYQDRNPGFSKHKKNGIARKIARGVV